MTAVTSVDLSVKAVDAFPTWVGELEPWPSLAPGFGSWSSVGVCRLQPQQWEETHHQYAKRLQPSGSASSCCLQRCHGHLWSSLEEGRTNRSHHTLQLTGGKNDKEEVKNYYFLHTLAAWITFAACQFVDSSLLPWNFVQIFVRMTLVIPWSPFVTETNGIPVSLSWTFCLFFMRKC